MAPDDPERPWFIAQATRRAEMEMVASYAGPYAEAKSMRHPASERFLAGGVGDLNAARDVAAGWFATEDEGSAARDKADRIARVLMRSLKAGAAVQAIAAALLDRGSLDGGEVDVLCTTAYGELFAYDRWAETWLPTLEQIQAGFLPARTAQAA